MYILLFVFWLLLCGKLTVEICLLGIAITGFMAVFLSKLFGYRIQTDLRILRKVPLFLIYVLILLWEIVKANYSVCRYILFRKYKVTPTLVTFHTDLKTGLGRFLLANSITLTPGTITVRVNENELTVHCLDQSMLDTSPDGVFQRWIRKLEA